VRWNGLPLKIMLEFTINQPQEYCDSSSNHFLDTSGIRVRRNRRPSAQPPMDSSLHLHGGFATGVRHGKGGG